MRMLGMYLGPLEEQPYLPSHLKPLPMFLGKESQGCVERVQLSEATFLEQLVFWNRTYRVSVGLTSVLS